VAGTARTFDTERDRRLFVNRREEVQHQGLSSDFLPRMPRQPNQFRRLSSLVVRSSSSSHRCGTIMTSSEGEVSAVGLSFGHLFASGRTRSRWRVRSAGLL
jgi:hypothetical protein